MKRITVLFVLLAVAIGVASTGSSATAAARSASSPAYRCLCEGDPGLGDTDVLNVTRPGAYGPGRYRATPTVRLAGRSIPGGVYRAALMDDPGAFGE